MIRKAVVAGQFYEGNFDGLYKQIDECFESEFGPRSLPLNKRKKRVFGVIAPHAGYQFSGPGAAWAYKEIGESVFPDVFLMLGLSHSGYTSCVSLKDWETPLGVIKTDKDFMDKLMANTKLKEDEEAHAQEHSIEVQLPFLQFVSKDNLKLLRIAPVIVSEDRGFKTLAGDIAKTIKESNKKVCIIASSDFTHYGFNYGYFPFSTSIKENIYKLDKGAIQHILKLDGHGFMKYVDERGATICGKIPIAVTIETCKLLGAKKAKLLHYYTSGDIINDYGSAVGYGAISIEQNH